MTVFKVRSLASSLKLNGAVVGVCYPTEYIFSFVLLNFRGGPPDASAAEHAIYPDGNHTHVRKFADILLDRFPRFRFRSERHQKHDPMSANFHELTANHNGCACPDTAGGEGVGKSNSDGFVSGGNRQPSFCNVQVGFANVACGRWDGSELSCNRAIRFRTRSAQSGNAIAPLDNEIIGPVHGVEGFGNRVIAVVNGGGLAGNGQSAAVNERALAV